MTKPRDRKLKGQQLAALEADLLKGKAPAEAVATYSAATSVTKQQSSRDLVLVKKTWAAVARSAHGSLEEVGRAIARRELLFTEALAAGDLATALAADRDRCQLLGLYKDEARPHNQ